MNLWYSSSSHEQTLNIFHCVREYRLKNEPKLTGEPYNRDEVPESLEGICSKKDPKRRAFDPFSRARRRHLLAAPGIRNPWFHEGQRR